MIACSILMLVLLQLSGSTDKTAAPPQPENTSQQQSLSASAKGADDPDPAPQQPQQPTTETRKPNWYREEPIPATTGKPGIFTVETAETLPKGTITLSGYTNKFGLAPGSATILSVGLDAAVGITKKIMGFIQFEPYRHIHIGEPSQLSLRMPPGCSHDVHAAPLYCGEPNPGFLPGNSWQGPAAAYVSGFPFAAYNASDYGPVTIGGKMNFWSENRGDALSVSLGAALDIPTERAATELAKFGAQTATLDYSFTLALSKTLWNEVVLANNVTYLRTGNPKIGNETLYTPGDVIIFGQGFIFRPQHRLQLMTEFTCTMVQEGHAFGLIGIETENTSLGPSDPVDGVWGVRWYFLDSVALDAGYRYMLNLHQLNDRSGFTIKISKVLSWKH